MSITLLKPQWNCVENKFLHTSSWSSFVKRGPESVISLLLLAGAFASFTSVSGGTSSSVKPWYKSLKVMAIVSHMSSSSSAVALALPWGIDESGLESDGVSVTDATAGPGAVIVRTGLSGRYTLIGTSSGDVTGFRCMVVIDVEVWAGASARCTSGSLVAADCAMICRDRDVSSDDTIETV